MSRASRYDGACDYSKNTADVHVCPNNFAFYCNGAALQDAAGGCPTDCSFLNEFCGPGCGQFRCDAKNEKCAPGHSCVITTDNHLGHPPSCVGTCQ